MGPLQRVLILPAARRAPLIGQPLFLVPCEEHRGSGALRRVGRSPPVHRAQLNENRKIKGRESRKSAPAPLTRRLGKRRGLPGQPSPGKGDGGCKSLRAWNGNWAFGCW